MANCSLTADDKTIASALGLGGLFGSAIDQQRQRQALMNTPMWVTGTTTSGTSDTLVYNGSNLNQIWLDNAGGDTQIKWNQYDYSPPKYDPPKKKHTRFINELRDEMDCWVKGVLDGC